MPLRILLVDDRPEVRSMVRIRMRLTQAVEIVGEATTGDEAISMCKDLRPEAIILDLKLPGVSGRDLCNRVLEACPESRVIAFTAYYSTDRDWYLARGVPMVSKEDAEGLVRAVLN